MHGGAAVVTGRLQRVRTINDKQVDDDWRFVKVYARQDGGVLCCSEPSKPKLHMVGLSAARKIRREPGSTMASFQRERNGALLGQPGVVC